MKEVSEKFVVFSIIIYFCPRNGVLRYRIKIRFFAPVLSVQAMQYAYLQDNHQIHFIMHRLVSILAAVVFSGATLLAQPAGKPSHPFNISLQGGALVSLNENTFSYGDNGKTLDLVSPQGGITFGYTFSGRWAARLSASYGRNAGACNTKETSAHGFYPYKFSSINVFADAMLNLTRSWDGFSPVVYAGVGGGHTFAFTDAKHPWQAVSDRNTAFGFRFGFIAQYNFSDHFGIYADLCGEAYTDNYNGLKPSEKDQQKVDGYAGFPLDLRGLVSLGCVFHF